MKKIKAPIFNYIVPVFNKEDILPLTLEGLDNCTARESKIYIIIDGCTDNSEKIVDNFLLKTGRNIEKIHMPDVHMLRSVNEALKRVEHGFSVIMQDDIVLEDTNFEKKIINLYDQLGPRLGVVSLRLAANVYLTSLMKRLRIKTLSQMIEERDLISVADDALDVARGEYENFYPRMAAINGPNVIPDNLRKAIGVFDDQLAPYGYDDPEYCIRAMKAGYINGLYPIKFRSDLAWGGTRRSKKFLAEVRRIHERNRKYIASKHGDYIEWLFYEKSFNKICGPLNSLNSIEDYKI